MILLEKAAERDGLHQLLGLLILGRQLHQSLPELLREGADAAVPLLLGIVDGKALTVQVV